MRRTGGGGSSEPNEPRWIHLWNNIMCTFISELRFNILQPRGPHGATRMCQHHKRLPYPRALSFHWHSQCEQGLWSGLGFKTCGLGLSGFDYNATHCMYIFVFCTRHAWALSYHLLLVLHKTFQLSKMLQLNNNILSYKVRRWCRGNTVEENSSVFTLIRMR